MQIPTGHKPLYTHLYVQVLAAIGIGVLLGHFQPAAATAMKPLGDGFIKLIKMMIAPIIFTTVVLGIAKIGDMKKVGRVGLKALIYFELVSTLALVIGLVVVNVVRPGAGINADVQTLDAKEVAAYTAGRKPLSTVDHLLHIIPDSAVGAFAGGEILQVLTFSVLFGLALGGFGDKGAPLVDLLDRLSHVLFGVIAIIMRLAPIGAFGAMAFTIGKYGVGTLVSLGTLMLCVYVTCFLFVFIVLGLIARLTGFSLWQFLRYIKEEILIVLGTSSSEAALPRMITKLENVGCGKSVVGLVIPTGYSFNLDGTSIYLTTAAIFIAQATNIPLSLGEQLGILGVLLLTSKGVGGRHRRRVHHAGRHARVDGQGSGRGPGALAGDRPVHVGGPGHHEPDRQRRGDNGASPAGKGPSTSRARSVLAEDSDLAAESPEALADAFDGLSANGSVDAKT